MPAMPDSKAKLPGEVAGYLKAHPATTAVDVFLADLSGVVRGKRYPAAFLPKLFEGGAALPGSVFLLSTEGETLNPEGRGFDDGDPDEIARAVPGSLQPVPWAERPTAQAMITLEGLDGTPYYFEPRNVLKRTLDRVAELELRPVVAFELEFFLVDRERAPGGAPQPLPVEGGPDDRRRRGPLAPIEAKPEALMRNNKRGIYRFTFRPRQWDAGAYRIVCRARDPVRLRGDKWPWVLRDDHGLLESERGWWVAVD